MQMAQYLKTRFVLDFGFGVQARYRSAGAGSSCDTLSLVFKHERG
jgi:hypothetical protein